MNTLDLDRLLGDQYSHATFHEAKLEAINVNFSTGTAELQFLIPCRFLPDEALAHQSGILEFQGLLYSVVEPVRCAQTTNDPSSLWIISDGPTACINYRDKLSSYRAKSAKAHGSATARRRYRNATPRHRETPVLA